MAEEEKKQTETTTTSADTKPAEEKTEAAAAETQQTSESAKPAEPAAESTTPPTPTEEKTDKPVEDPPAEEDLNADSAKSAFLDRFKKKPTAKKGAAETPAVTASNPDAVAEELYKQIVQVKGNEYIVLRFKKRTVLLILGLMVIAMWLIPLVSWGWNTWQMRQGPGVNPEISEDVSPSPVPQIEAAVRIRNLRDTEEEALNVATLLKQGGVNSVEIVPDKESSFSGIGLVTKTEKADLRTELEKLLASKYELATAAATLSSDSDFDAVIVVGTAE